MRIEYGDERVEVAFPGGCEERFDDLPLGVQVGVGHGGRTTDAAAGTARQLPRRLWRALHDRAISSNGTANMSCRTNASRSAGSAFRARQERQADRVGEQRLVLGIVPPAGSMIGSGRCTSSGRSRRVLRARSMFSATRATMVVSQPLDFRPRSYRPG
jgi:hypothetical protein